MPADGERAWPASIGNGFTGWRPSVPVRGVGHRQRQHLPDDLQPLRRRVRRADACRRRSAGAREGAVEAAAALGFASAIGAYGGFFIPKSVGSSLAMTGSASAALAMFIVFYLSCIAH